MELIIKKEINSLNLKISNNLTEFSKLSSKISNSYYSNSKLSSSLLNSIKLLEDELNLNLTLLSKQIEKLNDLTLNLNNNNNNNNNNSSSSASNSISILHALERYKEVYNEYLKDYQRTKTSLHDAEQRANLLGSVRDEISAFKSSSTSSVTDSLLSERNRIDSSHRMTDEVLGQAYATRAEFQQQRSNLQSINSRMNTVISQVPALNSIISMINSRRNRDAVIMGALIGVCSLGLIWYLFG